MPDQTSFIPKRTPEIKIPSARGGTGWIFGLALIFFILSLLLSFGLFFYRGLLESQVASLDADLKKVESEFEPSLILELQRTSKALSSAEEFLSKHVAVSRVLDFLGENTIPGVAFSNFSYGQSGVGMAGTARTYTALAQQTLIFEQSRLLTNVSFSSFSLTSAGFVNFRVSFMPLSELISYSP